MRIVIGIIACCLAAALVIFVGGAYTVFYTAVPLKQIAAGLSAQGCTTLKIEGNITNGFSVGSLSCKSENQEVYLKGLAFKYSSIFSVFSTRKFWIEDINVDRMTVKVLKLAAVTGGPRKSGPSSDSKAGTNASKKGEFPLKEFGIRRISINNVEVSLATSPTVYKLDSLQLTNFKATKEIYQLEGLELKSNVLSLKLPATSYSAATKSGEAAIEAVIHPAFYEKLRKDVPITAKVSFADGAVNGRASLDGTKLVVERTAGQPISIAMRDLTPSEYYATALPLAGITATANAPDVMGLLATFPGTESGFRIGDAVFAPIVSATPPAPANPAAPAPVLVGPKPMLYGFERGSTKFVISATMAMGPDAKYFQIGASGMSDVKDALASLQFQKKFVELPPDQQALITTQEPFFQPLASALPAPPPATKLPKIALSKMKGAPRAAAKKRPIGRAPASKALPRKRR